MAGAPAVASRRGPDGRRIAILPLPANDELAVIDADSGTLIRRIALGVEPIAASISADGRTAYVSILGGPKPTAAQRQARQCCAARAEPVRIERIDRNRETHEPRFAQRRREPLESGRVRGERDVLEAEKVGCGRRAGNN